MKAFNGFKPQKQGGAREMLPAGGYGAKILNAEEKQYTWGSVLLISFDILEGEHAGFFNEDYQNNTNEDRKWRGTYRLSIPNDDGSEKDEWTKRTFNGAIWSLEESNPGYSWNWDEKTLNGKVVGVLFRNKEWEMNGNTGWTTECCKLAFADEIRNGKFKIPKDKPLSNKSTQDAGDFVPAAADDNTKLPWETDGAL